MNRRKFVSGLGASSAAGAALTSCGSEENGAGTQERKRIRWKLASSYPRSLDTIYGFAEKMATRVAQLTDGFFEIEVYPAGELVPGGEVMDAVSGGGVEIGHTAAYYYKGKHPALAFETAVPFGLTARQQNAWLNQAGGLELMNEILAQFNIKSFAGGNTGQQMGGWFRKEINSLQDLQGLVMRIPGLGGEIMDRLGVTVQVLQGGEVYPALERGAIDAAEWVGPYDDQKLGFWQVAKNYYYPGWWEPGANISIYVNKTFWEELPTSYQAALEAACAESSSTMLESYDAKNPQALQELIEKGVNLRPFSADIMAAAEKESEKLHAELAASNSDYKRVYEHWKAFKEASSQWFSTAEQSYANHAFQR
tara:strand:- start:1837 stop:2934 length:1098 start_codon:yes stop_codon:yes gene_type:complete